MYGADPEEAPNGNARDRSTHGAYDNRPSGKTSDETHTTVLKCR